MRADRLLIGAVLLLGGGLWLIFAYCHGTTGLSFALPVSNTKLNIDVTTMGAPVLAGVPLVILGLLMMAVAFLAAIVAQFRGDRPRRDQEVPARPTSMP